MIKSLQFDSDLFAYPVGKLEWSDSWTEEEFLEEAKVFQLVYIFSKKELSFQSPHIQLVDQRITFHKLLTGSLKGHGCRFYSGETKNDVVEKLAFQSGNYSRFKIDSRLNSGEFEKLYRIWISNAIANNQVIVSPQLQGMLTYSVNGQIARVELLAVAEEFQGKGWGSKLLDALEYELKGRAKQLELLTQKSNIPALKLYASKGFQPVKTEYIYHYWRV